MLPVVICGLFLFHLRCLICLFKRMSLLKLLKIAKPLREVVDLDGENAKMSEDFNVFEIELADIAQFSEVINVVDNEGKTIGKVDKSTLKMLVEVNSRTFFSDIINNFTDGVVAIDSTGLIFFANAAYEHILKIEISKIIGRYIQIVEPNSDIEQVLTTKQAITDKEVFIKSIKKYVRVNIRPLYINGDFFGAYSIFSDITDQVSLRHEVKRITELAHDFERRAKNQNEDAFLKIIGEDKQILQLIEQTLIVAKTEVPILITGESGVGKELFMDLAHLYGSRKKSPLIKVNCAAIPETLIESELFGYVAGAFTGASIEGKLGKFELADGGTLFLDEIGELSFSVQAKLLRVIQAGEIQRIGSDKAKQVNVRLITATNQDLNKLVARKEFRKDLYYRINLVNLIVPPLRERKSDIPMLVNYYLVRYNQKYSKDLLISKSAYIALEDYAWPGNIRELKNVIERAVIMCDDKYITKEFLSIELCESESQTEFRKPYKDESTKKQSLKAYLKSCEKEKIKEVLKRSKNRSEAIDLLEISRRSFYRKLHEHNIS